MLVGSRCADNSPGDGRPRRQLPHGDTHTSNCPRVGTAHVGKGKLCSCGARKPDKKFLGLQILTWVWLARVKPELNKPKSTFRPQNFLSGLRVPHEQSFPFPTAPPMARGQLLVCVSPGGSCPPGGSCHPGQPSGGQPSGGQLSGGELSAHPWNHVIIMK